MLTVRLTQKLQKRLKLKPSPEPGLSTTRLGDWYANLVFHGRKPLVLAVSETTLLPVVFPAKGATAFHGALADNVAEVLRALEIGEHEIQEEVAAMCDGTIAKTANRSVLGSMNDFAFLMETWLQRGESYLDLSVRLAGVPCKPLASVFPDKATLEAFARPGGHLRLV